MIAAPSQSLAAAAELAGAAGCAVRILGDAIEGEAREVAADQAKLARVIQTGLAPATRPCCSFRGASAR